MKRLITTALSASLLLPVLAQANDNVNVASQPTPQADLSVVFDASGDNLQAIALSDKEMAETEGAVLPLVAAVLVGGATSAWFNHGASFVTTGKPASVRSTLFATGAGMVSGAYTNTALRVAQIPVSLVDKSAWKGATAVGNAVIRTNGLALGKGTVGVYGKGCNGR